MWMGKSKSEKADILFRVYALTIMGIEWLVYDMAHIHVITDPILDFVLG